MGACQVAAMALGSLIEPEVIRATSLGFATLKNISVEILII